MNQIWDQVQSSLREKLGTQNYEIWIRPIRLARPVTDVVELLVPNRYYRDWVQANYEGALRDELEGLLGRPLTIRFDIDRAAALEAPAEAQEEEAPEEPVAVAPSRPIPGVSTEKTFDNFVVGACNQFAHAASLAVADTPGEAQYNPLFIYGSTGLGKTHLMHAIGNQIRSADPTARLLYCTAEQFTNELIEALRFRQMSEFRDKYRKTLTVLLMDDVQFLTGKDRTQEELFHTFEWLKERGQQIVFTADVLPREIKGFEPRLRTRCESGMLADMQPPDLETLVAILHQKAHDLGLDLPPELGQYIAARVRGSIREVEGVLNRLSALCRLHRAPPTLEFARQHLGSVLADAPKAPSADDIILTVANFYNIKVGDLMGTRRLKQLVRPRHVAMWMVREHTGLSFPEIGRVFERDHATVQHACKKVKSEMVRDADLRNALQAIDRNLGL
jgi:chromosomal replication initiator protein